MGDKILKKVKALQPDVGLIRIAGSSASDWVEQVYKDGTFSLLRKPIEAAELLSIVEKFLNGEGERVLH